MVRRRKSVIGRNSAGTTNPAAKRRTPTGIKPSPKGTNVADRQVRVGLTLRLKPEAYRQLKYLAVDENKKAHDILIEGVNLAFKKYKKPMIA